MKRIKGYGNWYKHIMTWLGPTLAAKQLASQPTTPASVAAGTSAIPDMQMKNGEATKKPAKGAPKKDGKPAAKKPPKKKAA